MWNNLIWSVQRLNPHRNIKTLLTKGWLVLVSICWQTKYYAWPKWLLRVDSFDHHSTTSWVITVTLHGCRYDRNVMLYDTFSECNHSTIAHLDYLCPTHITTRSKQGMFGASVSELYLLIKSRINIERTVDLCVSDDKVLPIDERPQYGHKLLNWETWKQDAWSQTAWPQTQWVLKQNGPQHYTTFWSCSYWYTQAGPAHAADRGDGMDRWL